MKYSEIIGQGYFRINLGPQDFELVDAHFLGLAHHSYRFRESKDLFHARLFTDHLVSLYRIISERGDFSTAVDPTGEGLTDELAWTPPPKELLVLSANGNLKAALACLPDPTFIEGFPGDRRYGSGQPFPYDRVLAEPDSVFEITKEMLRSVA
jgi:hypothetical protein